MNIKPSELAAMFGKELGQQDKKDIGQQIVVLDRGFVYVGNVELDNHFVWITKAKNIRIWGTTKGLGELRNGPLSATKLDEAGEVLAPLKSVIHFISCKGF
jgi:hypothetical protein